MSLQQEKDLERFIDNRNVCPDCGANLDHYPGKKYSCNCWISHLICDYLGSDWRSQTGDDVRKFIKERTLRGDIRN